MDDAREISRNLEIISADTGFILSSPMKRESLRDWVNRKLTETGYSHVKVSERARRQGHKISAGYINNLAQGDADNPSAKLIKALAAGFGVSDEEVINVVFGKPQSSEFKGTDFEALWLAYKSLSPEIQRQKKPLIEMLIREIQHEI